MITGHFGLAAVVKSTQRSVPLWALMLAAVWLDVLFIPLMLAGVEHIDPVSGTHAGYGEGIIHADYTHSLVGSLVISGVTGWVAARRWGRRGGVVIGAVVFSHWVLDLIVHRADLALIPGTGPRLGLGLWRHPGATAAAEAALVLAGALLYWRSSVQEGTPKGRATLIALLLVAAGSITLVTDILS
ncbi:permease [Nonomuraea sediminis]|uniref:permease n=1 Tax=Nonomuraea sediminis TaxID=2835864 RepID=UPI001BDDB7FD|nr:permease [Nonomuraea sediminis]